MPPGEGGRKNINRQMPPGALRKNLSFYLTDVKSTVTLYEGYYIIQLLIDEPIVIGDGCYCYYRLLSAVVPVNFRNRNVESASKSAYKAFNYSSLVLEGIEPVQTNSDC